MNVTFFGTTTLLFDDGKDALMFDGHFTRPSFLRYVMGTMETDTAMADSILERFDFSRLRGIFVSHTHHDHVMDVPYIANHCHADIYGTESAANVARGGQVPEEQIHVFDPSRPVTVGDFTVTVIPSVHYEPTIINNDLGQTIDEPLVQPARKKHYKEGGSYDFLIRHGDRTILIRPSFNYLEGQLDDIRADLLFLGIGTMGKASEEKIRNFYRETIDKVQPRTVVPIHWDNFFSPLDRPIRDMLRIADNTRRAMDHVARYCGERDIEFIVQYPLIRLRF